MNSTSDIESASSDTITACIISGVFALVAVAIAITILIIIWRTKPRLHTIRHLLVCNTCCASILYCIIQSMNYAFLIFLPWETSDVGCRWRAYFAYITIAGVVYSFLIQAISRLFISLFSRKYKRFITFKVHYIVIFVQWVVVVILPLPAIVTTDIYFRPNALCWVPLKHTLHVAYTYIAYYLIPSISICIIYIFIYYRVKRIANSADPAFRALQKGKRDLELLRNILILLAIYLVGGIPTLLFLFTSLKILYLIGIATISLVVAIEKLCTIFLDRELRNVVQMLIMKTARVEPINNTQLEHKDEGTLTQAQ